MTTLKADLHQSDGVIWHDTPPGSHIIAALRRRGCDTTEEIGPKIVARLYMFHIESVFWCECVLWCVSCDDIVMMSWEGEPWCSFCSHIVCLLSQGHHRKEEVEEGEDSRLNILTLLPQRV